MNGPATDLALAAGKVLVGYFPCRDRSYEQHLANFVACVLALACSAAALAEDITLQSGKLFSVYAPPSCRKVDHPNFSLVLECNFRGKNAQFYLKEFSGPLSTEFDPRKNPPPESDQDAYLNAALRAVVDNIDRGLSERIRVLSVGSNTGDGVDALFWQELYLFDRNNSDGSPHAEKCVLVRVQNYRRGLGSVLVAFSDIDGLSSRPWGCVGFPRETVTILGSLGANFEGGRLMR
jgi:hypothetical protein